MIAIILYIFIKLEIELKKLNGIGSIYVFLKLNQRGFRVNDEINEQIKFRTIIIESINSKAISEGEYGYKKTR